MSVCVFKWPIKVGRTDHNICSSSNDTQAFLEATECKCCVRVTVIGLGTAEKQAAQLCQLAGRLKTGHSKGG